MFCVRTTALEAFRRLDTPLGDEAALVRALQGNPDPPRWQMEAGTEWHSLLASERPEVVRYGRDIKAEPSRQYKFDGDLVKEARAYTGEGLVEVAAERLYGDLLVTGRCDWINGLHLQDHKITFSGPDSEWYEPSLQWRFYLWIFGATSFRYNLWYFKEPDDSGWCNFKEVYSFRVWRYPEMEAECEEWLDRFLVWANLRGLLPQLEKAA